MNEVYNLFNEILKAAMTLIAVMNPFGNVPLFMGLTDEFSDETRDKIFKTVVMAGFGIVIGFGFIGNFIMDNFFKVKMEEVRAAGGLILIVVAFKNLLFTNKRAPEDPLSEEEGMKMGITPLAFPMLVGPGSMATVLIIKQQYGFFIMAGGTILAFLIIKLLFKSGKYIEKILGKLVLYLLSRIMQIFIMAVGVRLLLSGVLGAIELLK